MWFTIEEAISKNKGSQATLKRWIKNETVPSKLEGGRRLVWFADLELHHQLQLETIREHHREERDRWAGILLEQEKTNQDLVQKLEGLTSELQYLKEGLTREPRKNKTRLESEPSVATLSKRRLTREPHLDLPTMPAINKHLLEQVLSLWKGSIRELERSAGLSRGWIHKAKKSGRPKAVESWQKLQVFFKSLQAA